MKKRTIVLLALLAVVVIAAAVVVVKTVPFGNYDLLPHEETALSDGMFNYDLPLDNTSPWPKFRANTLQTGRTPISSTANETVAAWEYRTEKGIFSSPVVDKDGICYIGSADHCFYALNTDGSVKWKIQTGEIIDSSALLDNQGRIYFGSGDAKVYCADRETGQVLWTYQAQTAQQVSDEFDISVYNVNWFEGNVGILPDGDLLVPNDNYLLYRLDRTTGEAKQRYLANEMIWSLPSLNPQTGNMFFGTIYSVFNNVLSYNIESGEKRWSNGGIGATAATTLLTSYSEKGGVIVGSYDGQLRCITQDSGKTIWKLGLRDHIYSSPAQLSDGTIIQPCADGTIYAIEPTKGEILWQFDTLESIRSSPAVDGDDLIYVGSGEGKLFCISPDGTLRWSYQCITEGRNDLNGSPALGYDGVYIAGESGQIFFVPYDYPLRAENKDNPRCKDGTAGEDMPNEGGLLLYTTPLGGLRQEAPETLDANQSVTLTLLARKDGDTEIGLIDKKTLEVTVAGNEDYQVQVSADKRFLILIPNEKWVPDADGKLNITVKGTYKTNPKRFGMLFFWGKNTGEIDASYTFTLNAQQESAMPLQVPDGTSGASSVLEMRRMSIPNPTMLPSLNQIGFDSLHYLGGAVLTQKNRTLLWVVGGKNEEGVISFDPNTSVRFPLWLEYDNGLATFYNYDGFKINFVGSWDMPVASFRIAATYDEQSKTFGDMATYNVAAMCDEIEFYGYGLKLMGMSELKGGRMFTSGSLLLNHYKTLQSPTDTGTVAIAYADSKLTATLTNGTTKGKDHVYSLLVTDTDGNPISLYYAQNTQVVRNALGTVESVSLTIDKGETLPDEMHVYLMVDTYPAAMQKVTK